MSGVHDKIVEAAYKVLPSEYRKLLSPYLEELKRSSWYPDIFSDKTMPQKEKEKIDPEADKFIYPDAPLNDPFYRQIEDIIEEEESFGTSPLRHFYLIEHYVNKIWEHLQQEDWLRVTKFLGVYSHLIADIGEPIHAVHPFIIDKLIIPPKKYIGMELHANVEGLNASVNIKGYSPKIIGKTLEQVIMGAYAGLVKVKRQGINQVIPIVQALYSGKKSLAKKLSGIAQSESAKVFADFMYTMLWIYKNPGKKTSSKLDLRTYPWIKAEIDMLYRYKPMIDISLIPYSGGKFYPLCIINKRNAREKVKGLGVIPFAGPPYSEELKREAYIVFLLVPGAFRVFTARVGINPLFEDSAIPVRFKVIGDDKILFESKKMTPHSKAVEIKIEIEDVKFLKLSMEYLKSPSFSLVKKTHCDWLTHGVWAEPYLLA